MGRLRRAALSAAFGGLACALVAADLGPGMATRVSLGIDGAEGDGSAYEGSVSNSGRIVAFHSNSTNVHPGATAGEFQVFVRDLRTGGTELISADGDGNEGNGYSYYPGLSANGRRVVYYTIADNIAPDATPSNPQVVLFDRRTGETIQVSAPPSGEAADGGCSLYDCRPMSGNGRFVVFPSTSTNLVEGDANGVQDVFLYDAARRTTERISNGIGAEADGSSRFPSISPNGRWILYSSLATNLVEGDLNGQADVFLYDRVKRTTRLVSLADDGSQGDGGSDVTSSAVSNNGRWVAFCSSATNLVEGDGNGVFDVFLRDLRAGTTTRISVGPGPDFAEGGQNAGTPAITPDGRLVTYWTYASNMIDPTDTMGVDQIVYDPRTGTSRRALEALGGGESGGSGNYGYWNQMSPNGRWYVVVSDSGAIEAGDANGDWDVYLVELR